MLTPQERTIPARNPRIQVSSIHILDDESETSTFKYSPPKENQQKNIPLNMMAMVFFPNNQPKKQPTNPNPLFFWVPRYPPRGDRPFRHLSSRLPSSQVVRAAQRFWLSQNWGKKPGGQSPLLYAGWGRSNHTKKQTKMEGMFFFKQN